MIEFIVFMFILTLLEYPLYKKFRQAAENFDISRQTAILILMFFVAVFVFLIYKLFD